MRPLPLVVAFATVCLLTACAASLPAPAPTLSPPKASPPKPKKQRLSSRDVHYTRLFARCAGLRCDFDLTLDFETAGVPAELVVDPHRHGVHGACSTRVAHLTPEGRKAAARIRDGILADASLKDAYGQLGETDGPYVAVDVPSRTQDGPAARYMFDTHGYLELPDGLEHASVFFRRLRAAIAECRTDEYLAYHSPCIPASAQHDAPPHCGSSENLP